MYPCFAAICVECRGGTPHAESAWPPQTADHGNPILFCLFFSGCGITSPLFGSRAAAFSSAATATIAQTTNAYQLINQTYSDAQVATLKYRLRHSQTDPSKISAYLPAKIFPVGRGWRDDLEQRSATLLAEVSGDQPSPDLEHKAAGWYSLTPSARVVH